MDALALGGDEGRGKLRNASGSCLANFDPEMSEWGNPPSIAGTPRSRILGFGQQCLNSSREVLDFQLSSEGMRPPNKIGGFKQTQGTETSKYLEEHKSIEIPKVVASEIGRA